jgi:hypothetical protein
VECARGSVARAEIGVASNGGSLSWKQDVHFASSRFRRSSIASTSFGQQHPRKKYSAYSADHGAQLPFANIRLPVPKHKAVIAAAENKSLHHQHHLGQQRQSSPKGKTDVHITHPGDRHYIHEASSVGLALHRASVANKRADFRFSFRLVSYRLGNDSHIQGSRIHTLEHGSSEIGASTGLLRPF